MNRQLIALLHCAADLVNLGKVEPGCHALRVEIECDIDQVHVARSLTVAKEAALNAVGTRHQGEFACRRTRTAVIVRMNRQHNRIPSGQVSVHPLHHVCKDIGCGMLYR